MQDKIFQFFNELFPGLVANVTIIPVGLSGLKALREERAEVIKKKETALKEFDKEGSSESQIDLQKAVDELEAFDKHYEDCLKDPSTWKKSFMDDLKGFGEKIRVRFHFS